METRRAALSDLDFVVDLFDAYRQWYHQRSDKVAAFNFLRDRIQNNESAIFLAIHNGRAVGFTQLYPIFSSVGLGRAWLLNDMYVAPEARKQGVATSLLNAARAFAKAENARWLLLETDNTNYAAQQLYEKNGWKKKTQFFYELPL